MTLKAMVVATDSSNTAKVKIEDESGESFDLVPTMGEVGESIAVKIDEIINTISSSLKESITTESDLEIEISGSISLKVEAGGKWLFFNVGGGTTKSDTLKVVLKTKIGPRPN